MNEDGVLNVYGTSFLFNRDLKDNSCQKATPETHLQEVSKTTPDSLLPFWEPDILIDFWLYKGSFLRCNLSTY